MTYAIREVFNTIQGEGMRAGTRAVFCRFSGCNLWNGRAEDRSSGKGECARWCDTDFFKGEKISADMLVMRMGRVWPKADGVPRWCVLTGGEPMLQVDQALIDALVGDNWLIAVETNGTVAFERDLDIAWVCVSPKLGGDLLLEHADEVKLVLPGGAGKRWRPVDLDDLEARFPFADLLVQPQDPLTSAEVESGWLKKGDREAAEAAQFRKHLDACIQVVMQRPRWRLSLQTHKITGLP